ncbi:hypothetical protein BT96DRAFT_984527 [Gymnopus androsaceus JB14]|uniref:Uncharacterized protein n=1 Tax=Gymnopus androsaceus JB14 TaxID=1447944 RepID=A0A6A4IHH6_9AGAR|nr:hypothetical protein BT96DRAFT_984527 [Gymnopus androsaceus JB14]
MDALDDLKQILHLKDGWHTTFPNKKSFTFLQTATGSQSRIDRIYATEAIMETAKDLISVQITSEGAPMKGKGRWRVPEYVVKDKDLLEYARQQGIIAKKEIEDLTSRLQDQNLQRIWNSYKTKVIHKARERAKQIIPGLVRKINEVQLELDCILDDVLQPETDKIKHACRLQEKISKMEQSYYLQMQKDHKVKHRLEGDTPTRYWSQANKETKPRDMIYALKKPGMTEDEHGVLPGNAYEKLSPQMANIGMIHHKNLQTAGIDPTKETERDESTPAILELIRK